MGRAQLLQRSWQRQRRRKRRVFFTPNNGENDGKMMDKSWKNHGENDGKWWKKWDDDGEMMETWWKNDGQMDEKWKHDGEMIQPRSSLDIAPDRKSLPWAPKTPRGCRRSSRHLRCAASLAAQVSRCHVNVQSSWGKTHGNYDCFYGSHGEPENFALCGFTRG